MPKIIEMRIKLNEFVDSETAEKLGLEIQEILNTTMFEAATFREYNGDITYLEFIEDVTIEVRDEVPSAFILDEES